MKEENTCPVHKKVWGEEHWIVNRDYCGKLLVLRKGYRCSLHYHKIKDETFYIIKGRVLMELTTGTHPNAYDESDPVMTKWTVLTPGETIHIAPNQPHSFTGLENSEIIEFSSHHDDKDSYRITQSEKVAENIFNTMLKCYNHA